MSRAYALPAEPEADLDGYVPCLDIEIYPGDRIRVRDMQKLITPSGKSLRMPVRVNGTFQHAAARRVRTIVADIGRVVVGADGHGYVSGKIVDYQSADGQKPGNDLFRHKIGSVDAKDPTQKLIYRKLDHGPSDAERATETPFEMSSRIRLAAWNGTLEKALAAGVMKGILRQELYTSGMVFAEGEHARTNVRRVSKGAAPLPVPADIGAAQARQVDAVLRGEAEPSHWMWGIVNQAVENPSQFDPG